MTLVGVISFGAGLLFVRFFLAPIERVWLMAWDSRLTFVENDGGFTVTGIILVGLVAFLTKIAFVGVGYFSSGETPASVTWLTSGLAFFYYLSLYAANARMYAARKLSVPIVIFDVAALIYEIASGSRGKFAVYILFPLILIALFQRPRVGWLAAGALGAVVLVSVFVVYPLLYSYRNELVASKDPTHPSATLMVNAADSISESYDDKIRNVVLVSGPAEQVLAATSLVFFDVRHATDDVWKRVAFFWVPRALWPDKPMAVSGGELGRESHRLEEGNDSTSVLQTGIGELYVDFGAVGALGMFFAGLVFRFADVAFSAFRAPQFLRLGASIYLIREFSGLVTGGYEGAVTTPIGTLVLVFVVLVLLALGASIFAPQQPSVTPDNAVVAGGAPALKPRA
jgi:hypothetical protein